MFPKVRKFGVGLFSFNWIIKKPENNWTFSLQFVYQAWITDPKTALRQRRREKKMSAREEQKRKRKGSGEGECPGVQLQPHSPFLWSWLQQRNCKGQNLWRNKILKFQRVQRFSLVLNCLCLTFGRNENMKLRCIYKMGEGGKINPKEVCRKEKKIILRA